MSSKFTRFAHAIAALNRKKKLQLFFETMQPDAQESILDVGANVTEYSPVDNYLEKQYSHPKNITAVVLEDPTIFATRYPQVKVVQGDGTALPFPNDSFTIGYSNAVLEHVGNSEKQVLFLKELYRVSQRAFVTTPNRLFPIEVHTYTPLLHFFPKRWFDAFLKTVGKDWATGDYMHLLSKNDLRRLLAEAGINDYKIIRNRFLGLTMTFTVIWKK